MAGDTASHGLGLTFAAVGFATSVGDIVGGSLSENNKTLACAICGSFMLSALFSLRLLGWKETAPGRRRRRHRRYPGRRNGDELEESEESFGGGVGDAAAGRRRWTEPKLSLNRVSILKVFLDSR